MSTHHGKNGSVKSGANAVSEITEFSVEEKAETQDDSVMGDSAKTHLIGMHEWSGQITCRWDPSDTNGQQSLTIGASVSVSLYPDGSGSGATKLAGTATIVSRGLAVNMGGVISRTFQLQGNGALVESLVAP